MKVKTGALRELSSDLSDLQSLLQIKDLTAINAGSLYDLTQKLESIAHAHQAFTNIKIFKPKEDSKEKNKEYKVDETLNDQYVSKILTSQIKRDIREVIKSCKKRMDAIWNEEKPTADCGVDLGLTVEVLKKKLLSYMSKLGYSSDQDLDIHRMRKIVKEMLSEKRGPLDRGELARKHFSEAKFNQDQIERVLCHEDTLLSQIDSIKAAKERINKAEKLARDEEEWCVKLNDLTSKLLTDAHGNVIEYKEGSVNNTPTTPQTPGSPYRKVDSRRELARDKDTFDELRKSDTHDRQKLNEVFFNICSHLERLENLDNLQKAEVATLLEKKDGKNDVEYGIVKIFETDIDTSKSDFHRDLEAKINIGDIEPKNLYDFAIKLYEETSKKSASSEDKGVLRDIKASLTARANANDIKQLEGTIHTIRKNITQEWKNKHSSIDGREKNGVSVKNKCGEEAHKEKKQILHSTFTKLQSIVENIDGAIKCIKTVHEGIVDVHKANRAFHNHQQDVRTGQKKFINLKPWFSPKYALSRVTFFGSLAALSLGLMAYIPAVWLVVAKTSAITFGLVALEKFFSHIYSATVRRHIHLAGGKKPSLWSSWYYMPSTGTTNSFYSVALLALPYALFSMAWLPSIGIRATLATIGGYFESAVARYALSALGLSTQFFVKARSENRALPRKATKLSDLEIALLFKKIIPGKLLDQAFEGVALDFICTNQSNIQKVIKSTDYKALQNVLGSLLDLKTKKKGDIKISYIKDKIKELAKLVQLDGNYYTENALIKGARELEPLAEVKACELMKNAYHKDMERMIIDKHYGLDYSCKTLKPNEYNDSIASLTA